VGQHLAERPLRAGRRSIELSLRCAGERARQVAIGLVDLGEDPLRLGERFPGAESRRGDRRGRLAEL